MLYRNLLLILFAMFSTLLQAEPLQTPAKSVELQEIHEQLNTRVEVEKVDKKWSTETETRLRESFYKTASSSNTEVLEVTCKSTLCRFSVQFIDITAFEDFMNDGFSWFGFSMEGSVDLDTEESGKAMAKFFLLRASVPS